MEKFLDLKKKKSVLLRSKKIQTNEAQGKKEKKKKLGQNYETFYKYNSIFFDLQKRKILNLVKMFNTEKYNGNSQ